MESNVPPSNPPEAPAQPPPPRPPAPPPLSLPPRFAPPAPRKGRGWKITALILAVLLVVSLFSNMQHLLSGFLRSAGGSSRTSGPRLDETYIEDNDSTNKIAVITVEGIITSEVFDRGGYDLVDYMQDQLKLAEHDHKVKAVLLKVNSPGGEVLASDEIYRLLAEFQKNSGKPVVASMGGLAASGGYYISAPCRWIVANELSITGSIGVIMHGYNYRDLMDKVGLRPEVYKSGRFKDMMSGEKHENEITQEERDMVQKMINDTFAKFKNIVVEGRQQASRSNRDNQDGKGRTLSSRWTEYADGRVLSGKEAYDLGFVDELGNFETAVKRARKLAGINNADLIQYQQVFDLSNILRLLGKSETPSLKVDLGLDMPRLKAGQPYFLAPTLVH